MATPTPTPPAADLRTAREKAIDALCLDFANDGLSLPELERRLARAREARSVEELRALLADLSRPSAPVPAPSRPDGRGAVEPADATRVRTPVPGQPPEEKRPGSHVALAVLGGTRRAGKWTPPGNMLAVAMMGGVELDFREAVLVPGVTEINVFAFWGGVEITVPPDVHVDTRGMAFMGGFDQAADLESDPPAGAPTIRVNGIAIMGGVEVKVQERGEGRRRTKRERGSR